MGSNSKIGNKSLGSAGVFHWNGCYLLSGLLVGERKTCCGVGRQTIALEGQGNAFESTQMAIRREERSLTGQYYDLELSLR